jgi:3-hydroxyisobutyrate dehydrogenase-like beta-hydroxyacid dehydrogenase
MSEKCYGVIGMGEVGAIFSHAMADRGIRIKAYDVLLEQDEGRSFLEDRVRHARIELVPLRDMISGSEIVLSLVTTQVAEDVARKVSEVIQPDQTYVDMNSTSPAVKRNIGKHIEAAGAQYVEGAILGAVGATGTNTRILLTGRGAQEVARRLKEAGLNTVPYAGEIGQASAFKMLRSVFSKGLEALMLEMMIAARSAGIAGDLWNDVMDFMREKPFDVVAANWIRTHATAYERRYHEMLQVTETMRELGVEPVMTAGTVSFFKRSLSLQLKDAFRDKPEDYREVVEFMSEHLA